MLSNQMSGSEGGAEPFFLMQGILQTNHHIKSKNFMEIAVYRYPNREPLVPSHCTSISYPVYYGLRGKNCYGTVSFIPVTSFSRNSGNQPCFEKQQRGVAPNI